MCVKCHLSVSENSRDINGIVLSTGSVRLQTRAWHIWPRFYFSAWVSTLEQPISLVLTAPYTLDMRHCTIFRLGNTSSTGPDLWPSRSPDLTLVYCKMWDVIQHRVCRLTLTTQSSIREHLTWHKLQHNWQYSWQAGRSSLITYTEKL